MTEKCFVVLLGAGSSGKTTTRQAICGEPVEQERVIVGTKPRFVTFYEKYAVAGNHTSGSDANAAPDLIVDAAKRAFEERNVVFFDGVMGSPRLLEIPEAVGCNVLLVHFNLSQEEVVRRLMERRRRNGKVEDALPEKTLRNSVSFLKRAENTLKHFEQRCTQGIMKVEVGDSAKTEEIVKLIKDGIEKCLSTPISRSSVQPKQSQSSSPVRKIHLSRSSVSQ